MGFQIITGVMGGGKSYFACEEMLRAVKEGALIHTNLEIVPEEWEKQVLYPDQIVILEDDFSKWKSQIRPGEEGSENVVIVDEGALIFNSRDFAKAQKEKAEVFEFMVHSRHLGLDVLFISQHAKNIDAQLRRMAVHIVHCIKTEEIPGIGWLLASMPWFGTFRRHWMDQKGTTILDSKWAKFSPLVGSLYRTHMTKGRMSGVNRDVRREKKLNVGKRAMQVKLALGALVMLGALFTSFLMARRSVAAVTSERSEPATKPQGVRYVETPALPETATNPIQAAIASTYEAHHGIGRDFHGQFFVHTFDEGIIRVGDVYRDALVRAIEVRGRIVALHREGKSSVLMRPARRNDPSIKHDTLMRPDGRPGPAQVFESGTSGLSNNIFQK